jgi:catechol 2,3-dioxygenase-like lactoylglutathione lyase family enzyme
MVEVNGIAHIILTVSQFEECQKFYKKLLPFLGLKLVFDGKDMCYHVGARTAVGIQPCAPEHQDERFIQARVGLHHFCFRARSRGDIDQIYSLLQEMGAKIVTPPEEGPWAPGYYSVLFEDPDGSRIEVNYVPGKGVLAKDAGFNPGADHG